MTGTTTEAVTSFHVIAQILRELDARFGPDFSKAVIARAHTAADDMSNSDNETDTADGEALTEGLEWLAPMLK